MTQSGHGQDRASALEFDVPVAPPGCRPSDASARRTPENPTLSPTPLNVGLAQSTRELFRATCGQSILTRQLAKMSLRTYGSGAATEPKQPASWPKLRGDNENTTCCSVIHCLYCHCGMRDSALAIAAARLCVTRAIRRFLWGLVGRWHRHVVFWIERKDPMPRNLRFASGG